MVQFQITSEKAKEWFPETYNIFLEELRSSKSRYNDVSEDKMHWFISWAFLVKKAITEEEKEAQKVSYMNKMNLVYDDRIQLELPRIKCSITIKANNYYRTDRVFETEVPPYINDMAKEIVKITMVQEQNYFNNPIVMDSLKEFYNLYQPDEVGDNNDNLSIDDILDKISESGIQSLSPNELRFLEKMSKS